MLYGTVAMASYPFILGDGSHDIPAPSALKPLYHLWYHYLHGFPILHTRKICKRQSQVTSYLRSRFPPSLDLKLGLQHAKRQTYHWAQLWLAKLNLFLDQWYPDKFEFKDVYKLFHPSNLWIHYEDLKLCKIQEFTKLLCEYGS